MPFAGADGSSPGSGRTGDDTDGFCALIVGGNRSASQVYVAADPDGVQQVLVAGARERDHHAIHAAEGDQVLQRVQRDIPAVQGCILVIVLFTLVQTLSSGITRRG